MKVRELIALVRRAGGIPVRRTGSHEYWRLPDGARVTLVVHHPGAEASRVVEIRALAAVGKLEKSKKARG